MFMPLKNKILIVVVSIIAIIAIIIAAKYFLPGQNKFQSEKKIDSATYSYLDLNQKSDRSKVPSDIPNNLPIETELIVESYVSREEGKPAVLSTFIYISKKPFAEIYASYVSALSEYEVVERGSEDDP